MKKFLILLLLFPQIAFASFSVPLAGTTTSGTIFAFPSAINGIFPNLESSYFYATSTTIASQFPYASTTALSATTLCLIGDICRTTWPTGGGGGSGGGWTFIKGGIYNSTTTDQVFIGETSTTTTAKLEVKGGISATTPTATSTFSGTVIIGGPNGGSWLGGYSHPYLRIGTTTCPTDPVFDNYLDICGNDNTTNGVQAGISNKSSGANAFTGWSLGNDRSDTNLTNFAGTYLNSSTYSDTTFGTAAAFPNQLALTNSMGQIMIQASSSTAPLTTFINFDVGGNSTANEVARMLTGGYITMGTTTAQRGVLTIGTSTTPQLMLSDNTPADFAWTLRSINNAFYLATSTALATSTSAAFSINSNGVINQYLRNSILAADQNGNVTASTSIGANLLNGTIATVNANAPLGGGGALSYGTTLTLTCATCLTNATSLWPFTPGTVYGQVDQATSTLLALTGSPFSLVASSTVNFVNASTTNLTIFSGGHLQMVGLNSSILSTDAEGQVVASTSIGNNLLAVSGVSAGAYTNANITVNAQGVITTAANGSAGAGGGAWPWTLGLSTYGTTTNATTTPTWFKTGFFASSTPNVPSVIDNFTASNSTTTNATTTNLGFVNLKSALLSTNASGGVVSTTSIGTNFLTGGLGTINTSAPLGGGGAFAMGNTLTLTCTTCLTSVTDPFTHPVTSQSATTTLVAFYGNASTTQFTASSTIWFSGLTNALLATDNTGKLVATTSVGAQFITGLPAGANPSASLGLSAINGSATTFMRSDAAPALSQTIAPTWTGTHIFNNWTYVGTSTGTVGELVVGSSTAPQLLLSDNTAANKPWTIRAVSNTLYFATSTGTGTSTPAALSIDGSASAGLFVGTTTNANATIAFAGRGFWSGLTASAGLQTGIVCLSAANELINESVACVASSRRFKQDINPLSHQTALSEVMRMNPVSFLYKPSFNGTKQSDPNYNGQQVGFIAEEMQKIDPRLIVVDKENLPYSVRYENITAVLAAAIQELDTKIEPTERKAEENWQNILIALLFAYVVYNEWGKRHS